MAGIRILRPRPSTLVCLSFVEVRLGGGFLERALGSELGSEEEADGMMAKEVEEEEEESRSWRGKFVL